MGSKTDERPSRSCLSQWLTISGWCVQGLLEQRYFILSFCSRSKVITAVKGRRPKHADVVSAPCALTHGTRLKGRSFLLLWVWCGLVLLRLVLSLHLLPASVPLASSPPLLPSAGFWVVSPPSVLIFSRLRSSADFLEFLRHWLFLPLLHFHFLWLFLTLLPLF